MLAPPVLSRTTPNRTQSLCEGYPSTRSRVKVGPWLGFESVLMARAAIDPGEEETEMRELIGLTAAVGVSTRLGAPGRRIE